VLAARPALNPGDNSERFWKALTKPKKDLGAGMNTCGGYSSYLHRLSDFFFGVASSLGFNSTGLLLSVCVA